MPAAFLKCVRNNGKVITKALRRGRYMHLCKDKKGKWYKGEVKTKKGT